MLSETVLEDRIIKLEKNKSIKINENQTGTKNDKNIQFTFNF